MKEALKLALEALEKKAGSWGVGQEALNKAAIAAIKKALAQPEQESVELLLQLRSALALASAICDAVPSRESGHLGTLVNAQPDGSHGYRQIQEAEVALVKYLATPATTPPKRPWVGLTDEQRSQLVTLHHGWNEYGQAIEAALRSKNI